MPIFIVETAAMSPIREYWRVEAASPEEAAETYGDKGQCLYDEVLGEEEGRQVSEVHPYGALAGFLSAESARKEAPAMLAALRNLLPLWSSGIDEPWVLDARAILARIDGPTAQPAGDDPAITAAANLSRAALVEAAGEALALQAPISEAGDHCASCGAEEGESHGAQCETRGFAVGVDARRLDTGALRTVAGDDAAWLEATASRDGGEG